MSVKLPKKFEFSYWGDKFSMSLQDNGHTYACTKIGSIYPFDLAIDHCQALFDRGTYKITKNLDEPELVFPFTFTHSGSAYKAVKEVDGTVTLTSDDGWVGKDFPVDVLKTHIKEGQYIVTSVGEPESTPKDISTLTVKVDAQEATAAVKELTVALDELAETYKRVNKLMKGGVNYV